MNEVKISGTLLADPQYYEQGDTEAASVQLLLTPERNCKVTVMALGPAARELANFRQGESVRVEARLLVNQGKIEILGERFLPCHAGGKQPNVLLTGDNQHNPIRNFQITKARERTS
jgi:hypothetical protein